ncbi:hypothetical protein PILCRDRAFT_819841 [Piloderma croceum F 1598]|uniref:Uncharacterized protein n=1 Tax=Piloderma croceum (strain F 1598) TaxID=765440 RepID=A0A0C3B9S8_PILCF|nr:hypothetical protein PILCRDRAFT_819841 [Piloderma croceum F 1598]
MSTSTPTPTSTPASAPTVGTYYIYAQRFGVFLEFADGTSNLTTSLPTQDTSQQWQVAGSSSTSYTFKNVRTGNYIFYTSWSSSNVTQSQAAYDWYIAGFNGGYLLSPDTSFNNFWNVYHSIIGNNNPVIVYPYPFGQAYPTVWTFDSVTSNQSSSIGSSTALGPTRTGTSQSSDGSNEGNIISLGVGIGIGVPALIIALLAWLFPKFKKSSKSRNSLRLSPLARSDSDESLIRSP